MTCDFQQCDILKSVDVDKPVQPALSLETPNDIQSVALRLAKALISLPVCAGWSEPLLAAHTTLLEISCHNSFTVQSNLS